MRDVLMKYLLEAMMLTFAIFFVVQKGGMNRKTPAVNELIRVFVFVLVAFAMMDILAPQAIVYVRAGIGFAIGTHLAGGVQMAKV